MNIINKLRYKFAKLDKIDRIPALEQQIKTLQSNLSKIQESLGRIENRQNETLDRFDLKANEFRTFSQWGEDGIIQFLIRNRRKLIKFD
jgi:predicted  nucleic acid-binding Zn-ribbon protein